MATRDRTSASLEQAAWNHLGRALSAVVIVLLAPFLLGIAVAIRLTSPGPVIFRQTRYGLGGKCFQILKFRTMRVELEDASGRAQTVRDDPRVTAVGRFLRATSLDELPQFFNVLRGEMALVGPRPHVPGMLANGVDYEEFDPQYMLRHLVKPGITGLAQISGFRGETASEYAARNRLHLDLEYVRSRSVVLDLKILLLTVWQQVLCRRAY